MKRANERSLGEIIREVLKQHRLNDKLTETRIMGSWEKIMGTHIAGYTSGMSLRGKTLTVFLSSSVLRSELSFAKTKIIRMINEEMGQDLIGDIRFN